MVDSDYPDEAREAATALSVVEERNLAGDERDEAGDERDEAGDERDRDAEQRDRDAEQRDRDADTFETRDAGFPQNSLANSALARREAADDRRAAWRDRGAAASERAQSELDRSTALANRGASARERRFASVDGLAQFGLLAEADAAHRSIVEQLQEAVMPGRPRVRSTEFAVSYVASDPTAPTGGDLYDWSILPSGEVHIAVVDVAGHGVGATKDALSIVHTLRVLALQGTPLDEMVQSTDALLCAQNPELVATAIVARYDPDTGVVQVASGGHPPAIHVSALTGARQVAASGGTIGWPRTAGDEIATVNLADGDALIFYTDGVVEARKDIIEGTEALMRHAMELVSAPAEQMATDLMARSIVGAYRQDDSVVLILRRMPLERRTWAMALDPGGISTIRHEMTAWLRARGIPEAVCDDLLIVMSELASNALRAARTRLAVRLELDQDLLSLEIEDDGQGHPDLDQFGRSEPAVSAETARGLYIVRRLSDEVRVTSTFEGSVVRVTRLLREDEPRSPAVAEDCPPIAEPSTGPS